MNFKKLLGSITVGGVLGTLALYAIQHIDLSGLGPIGIILAPVLAAVAAAITHEMQSKSTTSGS